jgi:thiol-disulfide isomerase/thioredoxin
MKKWLLLLLLIGLTLAPAMRSSSAVDGLHPFGRGAWQEIRKAHAGQPLVVHFWGVTCGPCRTEMPQWGKFLEEHADLHLVMIDADLVPNLPGAVKTMLEQSGLAAAENWMFDDDFVERLRYEIDPQWQGEIPRTLLIAPDGTMTTIEGVADLDKIRIWLDRQAPPSR